MSPTAAKVKPAGRAAAPGLDRARKASDAETNA
jgi:hypothetical protein